LRVLDEKITDKGLEAAHAKGMTVTVKMTLLCRVHLASGRETALAPFMNSLLMIWGY